MAALAEEATPRLRAVGFGPARILPSAKYVPIRWPASLWFRKYTQNDDLHAFVYDDRLALRVHIDAFHGDRRLNNRALDLMRFEVEHDLLDGLAGNPMLDWRAAVGGDNQVCALTRPGGISRGDIAGDAEWVTAAAGAWLAALSAHPIPDLRARVQGPS
jgi:hypothetical protein